MIETTATKTPRRLSKKQKGFIKDYIATGNGTQAALNNYDIESDKPDVVAANIASENLRKPQVINRILSIAGQIPDELVVEKHKKLFTQKQLAYFTFSKSMSDEEITDHVNAAGFDVIVIRESDKGKLAFYSIDDAQAISKATDMAYKLKGAYAPEKTITLNIEAKVDEKDLLLATKLREQRITTTGGQGGGVEGDGTDTEPMGGEVSN